MKFRALVLVAAIIATAPLALAQGPAARLRAVDAAWLGQHRQDANVVVIHVTMNAEEFSEGRVAGARELPYSEIGGARGTLTRELPEPDAFRERLQRLGISDASTVVVYAHEAPMATRLLFTLAYMGLNDLAYLDGGLEQWRAESKPVERGATRDVAVTPGRITAALRPQLVADSEFILARVGKPGLSLVDTRTDGEYSGTGNRSGMPSAGHVAGARQLEWEDLFSDRSLRLRPRAELEALFRERVTPGDEVVTYCWVGYRASATWFVASLLGYNTRMYDGSYQDWQQRNLPTRNGTTP
jgi:thiosulfate/3-mercaptopyruvate sulfurtransferase